MNPARETLCLVVNGYILVNDWGLGNISLDIDTHTISRIQPDTPVSASGTGTWHVLSRDNHQTRPRFFSEVWHWQCWWISFFGTTFNFMVSARVFFGIYTTILYLIYHWLVVSNIFYSIIYGISYFPLTFIFFKMVGTTNGYISYFIYSISYKY